MSFNNTKILVTGGASFIGSHLLDSLIRNNSTIRVVDDLSSGKLANIEHLIESRKIDFIKGNLLDQRVSIKAVENIDLIFHLAAIHGGRGFVDMHQAACAKNLVLDTQLIESAYKAGVKKIVFASSGCVYPNYIQTDIKQKIYLKEKDVGPPYDPDNMYGWAKLSTEMVLKAYAQDYKMKSALCRFFTVYGPRGHENHAVMAMIARAFIQQDPYEIWGDGTQIRNWTYINDIVSGMILAAQKIDDAQAINLGTQERIKVIDAANLIFKYSGFTPEKIIFLKNMPVGPVNRVCNNSMARKLCGWKVTTKFKDGLMSTVKWYFRNKNTNAVKFNLPRLLTERN